MIKHKRKKPIDIELFWPDRVKEQKVNRTVNPMERVEISINIFHSSVPHINTHVEFEAKSI